MQKLAPLTKLLSTVFVTVWAILLHSPAALTMLIVLQILLLLRSKNSGDVFKGIAGLLVFAAFLAGLQYIFSSDLLQAIIPALKMTAMTLVFFILLTTTRIQDLSAALVSQCHVPQEYAFMITAALRFIPDLLAESKSIQEAQACRGYSLRGNPFKRLTHYIAIVKPLVLKTIGRSETMALSLELRGFGNRKTACLSKKVTLVTADYALLFCLAATTLFLVVY